jgi:uncharacterized protein YeaC (DUF1315 family)
MDYLQAIESLTPEIYQRLKRAVELGKWPDGNVLTREQRANALQAIIAWDDRHRPPGDRIGFIERKQPGDDACEVPHATTLRWIE